MVSTVSVKTSPASGVGIVTAWDAVEAEATAAVGAKVTAAVKSPPVETRWTIVITPLLSENANPVRGDAAASAVLRAAATACGSLPASTSAKALPIAPPAFERLTVQRPASFAVPTVTVRVA